MLFDARVSLQRYKKYLKLRTQMCTFPQKLRTRLRSFRKILHGGLRRNGRFSMQENIQFCHVGNYLYFCNRVLINGCGWKQVGNHVKYR